MIDLVNVMEGPQFFDQCILGLPECSSKNPCPLHSEIKQYRTGLVNALEKETIGEFAKRTEKNLKSIKI
jgi:DNA-binding IscR family transcriptional regulator